MGQVQFWEGEVLFVDGKVAMHEDCCCGPCSTCYVDQPEVVVSVGDCDAVGCRDEDMHGPIPFSLKAVIYDGEDPVGCRWQWGGGEALPVLHLAYCFATSKFYATEVACFGGDITCPCAAWMGDWAKDVTDSVSCNPDTGIISGEFTLHGHTGEGFEECIATFTLG